MPTYNKNILTNAGSRLLSRVDGGADKIKFSKVAFSSEDLKSLNDDQVKALTSINPIELSAVPQVYLNDDTGETNIRSYVSNENSAKGLYVSTYAVFAKDSNDREILFSVECSDTPDYLIPNPDGSHPSGLLYNLKINVSDTNNVVFTSDTQVYATKNELEALNKSAMKFLGTIPDGTDTETLSVQGIYTIWWGSKDIKHLPIDLPCWGSYQVFNTGATYHLANLNDQMYYRAKSGNPEEWHDWVRIVREDDLVDLKNKSLETNDLTINNQLKTAIGPTGDKATLTPGIFEQKLANGKRVNRLNWDGISTDADLDVHGEIKGPTINEIKQRLGRTQEFKGIIPDGTDTHDLEPGLYFIGWWSKDIKNLPAPQPCWGSYEVIDVGPLIHKAHLTDQTYTCSFSGSPSEWSEWRAVASAKDIVNAINNEVARADDKYVEKSSYDRYWEHTTLYTNNGKDDILTYIKDGILYFQGVINVNEGDTQIFNGGKNLVKDGLTIKGIEGSPINQFFTVTSFTEASNNHSSRFRVKNGHLMADWVSTGSYDLGGIALPIA